MQASAHPTKAEIRAFVRRGRAAMTAADRMIATKQLTRRLISLVERSAATSVACYSAVPDEPDTGPFIDWALTQGLEVLLPVSLPDAQLDWVRHEGAPLVPGRHGITVPTGELLGGDAPARTDVLLVPACAVDSCGTRLGWGMGYYDRCLVQLPATLPVYAVVFDADRLPQIPRDPHDIAVTGAVSPGAVTTSLSRTG
ncbi:5-formyltetrahydrofolate cyclo-ligase [Leucobacter exalbidus]|uniref:5-formyltetrahydrofolate cyclo-ligase n=1 Tax=Leucobacter exalbidus TaxID=662960 RepID=A0A940PZU9_9MICO|nr:5-formyltetrahydrofolate cyclo-ligase [Leucobacter exalbidus]MBP1327146.1 5-formyltetrahydrofolate cyclo-ligase [Leucobacter exalbidus]